ncbi:MAG: DUF4252 domain-containing protein [Acidobacteriota bacterium]
MKALLKSALFLSVMLAALPAEAQDARLKIDHLDKFSEKASELIDVTVDENLLQLAAKFLNPKRSPEEAAIKELISGLKGVFVRRFAFQNEGEFTREDVESVRSQLHSPGWSRIVGVRSRKKTVIDVEVYIMTEGAIIKGLGIIAIEPKALTVANVVGPIDLEKLSQLEGKFGIPRFDLVRGDAPDAEDKPKKPEGE